MRVPIDGGPVLAVSRHREPAPAAIVVDDTTIYWSDLNAGDVMSVPLGGGETTTLATMQATDTLVLDSTALYWTAPPSGTIDPSHVVMAAADGWAAGRARDTVLSGDLLRSPSRRG
jgi:hypothetical protein